MLIIKKSNVIKRLIHSVILRVLGLDFLKFCFTVYITLYDTDYLFHTSYLTLEDPVSLYLWVSF